jgi:hypothetical protein
LPVTEVVSVPEGCEYRRLVVHRRADWAHRDPGVLERSQYSASCVSAVLALVMPLTTGLRPRVPRR